MSPNKPDFDTAPTLAQSPNTGELPPTRFAPLSGSTALIGQAALDAPLPSEHGGERYQYVKTLGTGGMGEVRLCQDDRIGREIALKVMRRESSSADAAARFIREARVQGQLEHPSVVPVYDLGKDDTGALYFTMKRIRGVTLDEAIHRRTETTPQYSQRRLLTAFVSVCLAVEFAHSRGVLHRDLKPGNIMLGEFGEVNVLDWGVAKILGAPAAEPEVQTGGPVMDVRDSQGGRTVAGVLVGTPGYMSPEQASGAVDSIDVRSDVYSLGAILFEIVTGEYLHDGSSVSAILESTTRGPRSPRPSTRNPEVAPEIDAICEKATALDPKDRFASARELCDALEHFLDGDRDLMMRREMAEEHVLRAREAPSHAVALQEAFRALALRPDDGETRGLVARLLLEAPDEVPEGARAELDALRVATLRTGSMVGGRRYLAWFLFIPLALVMGVRSWPTFVACFVLMLGSSLASFAVARAKKPTSTHVLVLLLLSMATASSASMFFGPFVIVPALAAANALIFTLQIERRQRLIVALSGLGAVLVPFGLELVGVLPPSSAHVAEGFTLVSRAVTLAPGWVEVFLLASSVGILVTTTATIGKLHDDLAASERKSFLQAWHLRNMVR